MFQTKIEIPVSTQQIAYTDRVMTLGSCFAENIGRKLRDAYFQTDINPFGVLYNPISIRNSLYLLLENNDFTSEDIFENKSLWQSFAHSSLFSDTSAEGCLTKLNSRLEASRHFLQKADYLLITFGTAWVFEDIQTAAVVSNCHKLPASRFTRRRLTVDEIVATYSALLYKLQARFPKLQLIFSVSPIRHWKDGAHDNNLSKSTLLIAIEALQELFNRVHYFPAYEIQLDELRDYRFYASDMLHPSAVAVNYIWSRFSETYFSEKTLQLNKRLEQLAADLAHRALYPASDEYAFFLKNIQKRKTQLKADYPFLADRL